MEATTCEIPSPTDASPLLDRQLWSDPTPRTCTQNVQEEKTTMNDSIRMINCQNMKKETNKTLQLEKENPTEDKST